MSKILVVEDNPEVSTQLVDWLNFERHTVDLVQDGKDADFRLTYYSYDIVILDWELPGLSGIDVCKRFRDRGGKTPILMLTGKDSLDNKAHGLDTGADDYLTKPFHLQELSARIRAILRRPQDCTTNLLKMGALELDTATHSVSIDGKPIELFPKEYALLEFFMRHPGQVFSTEALLERVWSSDSDASVDTIYTYIRTLRQKLQSCSSLLKTLHRVGYKMEL